MRSSPSCALRRSTFKSESGGQICMVPEYYELFRRILSDSQAGQVELMNCNGDKLMQYYAEQIAELKCAGPLAAYCRCS